MRIYLDYNASAPLRPEARARLLEALAEPGNPSSPHREGQRARARIEQARREVAALAGAEPREVVFTGSGTEALNLGLRGLLGSRRSERDQVLVSAIEHEATRMAAESLRAEGVHVLPVGVDARGVVALDELARKLTERTAVVAVMLANNETGVIQPLAAVRDLARRAGAWLVVDAVQGAGRIPVDFRELGAACLALSAHKLGGPQGVGALVARRGLPLEPIVWGGGQERGLRAGTEATAAIAGFGAAASAAGSDLAPAAERLGVLGRRLQDRLLAELPGAWINGAEAPRVPGTLSITVPGLDAEAMVVRLDLEGVAASTGSACASGTAEPSRVLTAMGLDLEAARSTLRLSLGWASREADVDQGAERIVRAARRTLAAAAPGRG